MALDAHAQAVIRDLVATAPTLTPAAMDRIRALLPPVETPAAAGAAE